MVSKKYLKRIGIDGLPKDKFESLRLILEKSSQTIPFENLNVHLGVGIDLAPERIRGKLLDNKRGGYCYEVNGLLASVLNELGFNVTLMGARTIMGYTELRPITHMLLKVSIGDNEYLCDLGFAGMNSIYPLRIGHSSCSQDINNFRLSKDLQLGYILESYDKDEHQFKSLYSFENRELKYIDFELANYYNSHSKDSICTNKVICSINTQTGSIRLVDDILKIRTGYHDKDIKIIDVEHLGGILNQYFSISLSIHELGQVFKKIKQVS